MSRLPIRARLTAAFALALVLVLALAGLFVYLRVESALNETLDDRLEVLLRTAGSDQALDPEDEFSQVLGPEGRIVRSTLAGDHVVLRPEEIRRAQRGETVRLERRVPDIEDRARIEAFAGEAFPSRADDVTVIGVSTEDRDETLAELRAAFLVGSPLAVLLASALGYAIASRSLRPVEAMRRRAESVSLTRGGERLPLPEARDEVRRLGETLNEMLARLQASFERERRFVADASHELRTPLAVLKTELESALRRGGHSPEVRESLAAAIDEADQLAQLAEDLLLIARAADEGLPVRPEDVEVRELLERAAQRFADRAREHGRSIEVDAPEGLSARVDPLRARQALGNLIDNALRHGAGDIELSARERDESVEIEVTDAGPGFPPELAARAFERFARGDAARTRGGAGLGLAIVGAIAEAHGGSARVVPGARGAVRLSLPAPSQGRLSAAS